MGYVLLVLTIIISANCGGSSNKEFNIKGFDVYYLAFVLETGRPTDNLVITFGDTSPGGPTAVGFCRMGGYTPRVTIDKTFWDKSNEDMRYELIYHELGHCILGREHNNAVLVNHRPASIMNSHLFNPNIIKQNHDYYIRELVIGGSNDKP